MRAGSVWSIGVFDEGTVGQCLVRWWGLGVWREL